MNIDDKRPWIVFNIEKLEEYLPPGSRLRQFGDIQVPFSHARLEFDQSNQPAIDDNAPAEDFWQTLFESGGNTNFKLGTIFQDACFAIGKAVWNRTKESIVRPGDFLDPPAPEVLAHENAMLAKQTLDTPPHPEYAVDKAYQALRLIAHKGDWGV